MSDTAPRPETALALVADLLFASRVRATAEMIGVPARVVRNAEDLVREAKSDRPRAILIDLSARNADPPRLIARLKADPATADCPIVAFASHLDQESIEAARLAGADRILARSAFVKELPALLGQAAGS